MEGCGWGVQTEHCSLVFLTFVETGVQAGFFGVVFFVFALALSARGDKWADLSVSAVTFIKEIWPSSGESSTTP